jgi:Protein of unknown function (DUF1460)
LTLAHRPILILIIAASFIYGQAIYTPADSIICLQKLKLASDLKYDTLPIGDLIVEIGKSFIGTQYLPNSLEKGDKETLVAVLSGFDCYTFLEASLVLARCIKEKETSFDLFLNELEKIRYRSGRLNGYDSRLHYFADWISDMNKRGIGVDITRKIGGVPYIKKINFMSAHPAAYRQLKADPSLTGRISLIENEISSRSYYFIPQKEISKTEMNIRDGDIIGITTNIEGLDISHTGIAIRGGDGRIHLLHAPNVGYKVQITEKPLAEYIAGNKKQTGIIVLRPSEIK